MSATGDRNLVSGEVVQGLAYAESARQIFQEIYEIV